MFTLQIFAKLILVLIRRGVTATAETRIAVFPSSFNTFYPLTLTTLRFDQNLICNPITAYVAEIGGEYTGSMAESALDLGQLSSTQQEALNQYTQVTNQEITEAIPLLRRSEWNVQVWGFLFFIKFISF